ncbi:hypothetical protein FCR2A7T_27350 [Flavobacterium cauense R2A-7]|uniref:Uncharacterized protein DUF3788 n=1 Tax=Flavobacterium cauense R2A-7 TaxID=1341154 RepID=V6S2Q7_9FLAO|nr:DUF3788 domain-containing protein [Flavobacterium cauense]ESU18645.1 hypothetical protein FCR2A7T_27350 [Flavobacterium cauense R2A-7]KGO82075.1 hypothetical protein Q762_05095 [Flavobacterium cauense R2A-7]TWI15022.1 uncharacterized protein DUF3788 [Flavobacterium cauense R2A-7]
MKSIFTDKTKEPSEEDLQQVLGETFMLWKSLAEFTKQSYPKYIEYWHFSGDKYGWNFRISDKKRALLYLLPRDGFFKAALVFGQKATDEILKSEIDENIKNEILTAKVYAEGRGIRITVNDKSNLDDIKKLITIKISN